MPELEYLCNLEIRILNKNIRFEYPRYSIISGKRVVSIWLNCN